jgi:hypothetical protein
MRASGDDLIVNGEFIVTLEEIMAMVMIPSEFPNCATVLKTAPARACVCGENASVIMRLATVKITISIIS